MPKQKLIKIDDGSASGDDIQIDLLEAYKVVKNSSNKNEKSFNDLMKNETKDNRGYIESEIKKIAGVEDINDIWQKENCYLIYFEVYNPNKITIKEINIDYIKTNIIFQKKQVRMNIH